MQNQHTPPAVIVAEGLSKSFGAVQALRNVSLQFESGKVHGLVGANGAGKSTFLHILGGVVQPDSGSVLVDGTPVTIASPRDAAELGFSFIYQELALIPEFSASDNMTIGMPARTVLGMGDGRARRAAARGVAERLGLSFDLDKPVAQLTVAERGLVAIGRALIRDARFVAMDEPTAALSDTERDRLFDIVRELTASGVAVAYVSHRLDEIEAICDTVTVFKDGRVIQRHARAGYTRDDLVQAIAGAGIGAGAGLPAADPRVGWDEPVLEVRHLSSPPRVKDVSFTLHRGEILGLAGVVGSGRTEITRMIFGADRPGGGEMVLHGRPYAPASVVAAIEQGVALVPEERRSQALIMDASVAFNITMGNWVSKRWVKWLPFVNGSAERKQASGVAERLGIKMRGIGADVRTLSGGNQQKVVFGRWLSRDSQILLLDEPTRGVDVGARRQIWDMAENFAREGKAVLVVCSELEELAVCHRIVVIAEGRDVAVIDGPRVTEAQMLAAIYASERGSDQK